VKWLDRAYKTLYLFVVGTTAETIIKTYPELVQLLDGDLKTEASAPCSQVEPKPKAIVYVAEEKYLEQLIQSPVSLIVVHDKIAVPAKEKNARKKTLLTTKNTYLAMALINARFFSLEFKRKPFITDMKIHPTAVVAPTAQLADGVILGPHAVISDHVKVGARTYIGAHTVIEPHTQLGEDGYIHPHVYIGHSCRLGNRVEIKPHSVIGSDGFGFAKNAKGSHHHIPHYGPVLIEDDVYIGANVNVDRGTFESAIIGEGTKIDNHCHLGHNCKVGKNCIITAGIIVAGSTTIGSNCVFAGRVSVNGHITICDGCSFGPMSGITNDVTEPGVYAGFPIIPFRDSLKSQASMVHLPRIRKNLTRVMKHLGLTESDKG